MEQTERPELCLSGCDGNAFMILGRARKVAHRAGWGNNKIEKFTQQAEAGDYDHLLQTCMEWFDVT